MSSGLVVRAEDLLHGALGVEDAGGGWVRPRRFSAAQLRALGSVRAWHPGLYRQMAACTAGVCLEFETTAARVGVEVSAGPVPRGTASTLRDVERHAGTAPDPRAVSVAVDGLPPRPALPDEHGLVEIDLSASAEGPADPVALPGMGRRRHVRVWLPCLAGCAVRDVFFDGGSLGPVAERPALLVLGDSIVQGFVADQPAGTWAALLAGEAGLDLVNQGVGGQVFQPGSLWGLEGLDPAAIVVEFGENYRYEPCAASAIGRDARAYLAEVANAWPEVPTWVLGVPPHTEDVYPTHPRSCFAEVDGIIADAVARHPSMTLVDASSLLDGERLGELLADGSDHPGPRGHEQFAERLGSAMGLGGRRGVGTPPEAPALDAAEKDPVPEQVDGPAQADGPDRPTRPAGAAQPTQLSIFDLLGEPEAAPSAGLEGAPVSQQGTASQSAPKDRPKKGFQRKKPSSKNRRSRRSRR